MKQGRTRFAEMLRVLDTTRSSSSTTTTTSLAKLQASQTITIEEPSLRSPFLEKEKEMLELRLNYYLNQLYPTQ